MKKISRLYLLILILAIPGCIGDKNNTTVFNEVFTVSGEVFIDSECSLDPSLIDIVERSLVLCNEKTSPLIEIYDLSSKKLLNRFLNIGGGPNEVLTIGNIQYNQQRKELLVSDLFQRKMFHYKLDDIIKNNIPKPEIVYQRPEKSQLMFDKLYEGEDFLIAESRDPKGRILLIDRDGKEIGYYLEYPSKDKVDETLKDINNAKLYSSSLTISPSLDKIALATYGAGMIDICKIEKDHIVPQWNYTEFYPQGIMTVPMGESTAVAHTLKSRNGFPSISSSDKYVYALFSGKLLEDPTYPYGEEIYVVSWDGKDTYKIKLDKSINRLAVDAKDEYIYGITPEMDIVRFPIPKR